jgi:selenide,water dikinase
MQVTDQPVLRDIVLVGGGHSHVGVLRRFAMQPMPGVRLTLICRDVFTPYSGMLPGYVAGLYTHEQVHIDLARLARYAGARFFHDEAVGLDRDGRRVLCRARPPVSYDLLSINIGSAPRADLVPGAAEHAVPVKPITGFDARWRALLERVRARPGALRIAVVGGGAGGVELVLGMRERLRAELAAAGSDPGRLAFHLIAGRRGVLPTHNRWVRNHVQALLLARGISVHAGADVTEVGAGRLLLADGSKLPADEIVWVTRAGGAGWLRDTGLALDADGFVRVLPTLQTVSDPAIFAAGDIAAFDERPLEKAGVFAVRMGRPLADNLRRAVQGRALRAWRPQRSWLALIGTGTRHAIASRGPIGFAGDWVWRWKDWIDRRFMARYTDLPPMTVPVADRRVTDPPGAGLALREEEAAQALSAIAMRCGGCGAKVGATVLSRALADLHPLRRPDVLIGLDAPDDAAVVAVPPGMAMVHTVDFFRAFIDDPWVFGRIAANHALGDVWAMGGQPQSATAIVTVPPGLESKTEDLLRQMMRGAVDVLDAAGCALVGGHTGEGRELALGFAINGLVAADLSTVLRKGGMRPGDRLLLTKPIGTGTLFAAHDRLQARGDWIDAALVSMMQSNRDAARCLFAHGATACTDLTGFGLLGHLVEMTRPSGVDAVIELAALPLLPGAEHTAAAGILSSLQPANLRLRRAVRNAEGLTELPRYRLLFDPQTAGGLLASVPADRADACLAALRAAGCAQAAIIGRIETQGDAAAPIVLEA